MVKIVSSIEYKIPEQYLSLIFNADYSGLTDKEIEEWDNFYKREELMDNYCHWVFPDESDPYFSWTNDVNKLGGNVYDLTLLIHASN